ncbi:hypothetical protein CWI36_0207p0010 [Hamiltosporidium magnivora]|uniref:Uncharacterized protein n=1 Tax=Hamiltosporidium magnivora TaxID=148818 RepID=A0A4Q9LLB9_9MICR|nr:hypothetical protein CWI36_0207p0010 [Hamiltosporidium magnivora]
MKEDLIFIANYKKIEDILFISCDIQGKTYRKLTISYKSNSHKNYINNLNFINAETFIEILIRKIKDVTRKLILKFSTKQFINLRKLHQKGKLNNEKTTSKTDLRFKEEQNIDIKCKKSAVNIPTKESILLDILRNSKPETNKKEASLHVGGLSDLKIKKINEILDKNTFDILALVETWRDTFTPISKKYAIAAVKLSIRVDYIFSRKKGTIILITKNLTLTKIDNITEIEILQQNLINYKYLNTLIMRDYNLEQKPALEQEILDNHLYQILKKRFDKKDVPNSETNHIGLNTSEFMKVIKFHGLPISKINPNLNELINKFILDGPLINPDKTVENITDFYNKRQNNRNFNLEDKINGFTTNEVIGKIATLKTGKSDTDDFRPNLSIEKTRKLFEELILSQINLKIHKQQSGFKPGYSTLNNTMVLETELRHGNGSLICVTLDFIKAYDSVDRSELYHKMLSNQNLSLKDTTLIPD